MCMIAIVLRKKKSLRARACTTDIVLIGTIPTRIIELKCRDETHRFTYCFTEDATVLQYEQYYKKKAKDSSSREMGGFAETRLLQVSRDTPIARITFTGCVSSSRI